MENREATEAQDLLDQIGRSSHAGYVAAAQDPLWLWPVIGVLAGVFVASFGIDSTILTILATLIYCVGIGAAVGFAIRRRGVQPNMTKMPKPLAREFTYYLIGSVVVVASVVGVGFGVDWILAGVLAFVAVSLGGTWYHVRWRAAVDRMVTA